MKAASIDERRIVALRPLSRILIRGLVAFAVGTTPIFLTAYWLTIPTGLWPAVVAFHLGLVGTALVAIVALMQTKIQLTSDGVSERGYLGRVTRIPRTRVSDALLLQIFDSHSTETRPHLFLTGHAGELRLRMRGHFWSLEQMEEVVRHLGVQAATPPKAITLAELRESAPQLLYWFERW